MTRLSGSVYDSGEDGPVRLRIGVLLLLCALLFLPVFLRTGSIMPGIVAHYLINVWDFHSIYFGPVTSLPLAFPVP